MTPERWHPLVPTLLLGALLALAGLQIARDRSGDPTTSLASGLEVSLTDEAGPDFCRPSAAAIAGELAMLSELDFDGEWETCPEAGRFTIHRWHTADLVWRPGEGLELVLW